MSERFVRLAPNVKGLDIARAVEHPGLLEFRPGEGDMWEVWVRARPHARPLGVVPIAPGGGRPVRARLKRHRGGCVSLEYSVAMEDPSHGAYMDGKGDVWWYGRDGWLRLSPDGDPMAARPGNPSGGLKHVEVCYLPCDLSELKHHAS